MRKWILLLMGVVAALIVTSAFAPTGSEAVPDCSKPHAPEKHCPASSGSGSGSLVLVETSTKTKGATTVTWDSSFEDMDYTLGDPISVTVTWTVDAGAADYIGFDFKDMKHRCTPKDGVAEPAECSDITNLTQSGQSVSFDFSFTALHYDQERDVEIGTAHFKLDLLFDVDGDGTPETPVGLGVNVHVEDPQ